MEVILGTERRRWSEANKRGIVAETFAPGTTTTEVARRHRISTGMLFTWRKQLRAELGFPETATSPARFMPLAMIGAPTGPSAHEPGPTIKIDFDGATRVLITGAAPADLVAIVLKALARK